MRKNGEEGEWRVLDEGGELVDFYREESKKVFVIVSDGRNGSDPRTEDFLDLMAKHTDVGDFSLFAFA